MPFEELFFEPELPFDESVGALPHWSQGVKYQFVTAHLCDSLPADVVAEFEARRKRWLETHHEPYDEVAKAEYKKLFNNGLDRILDAGYGSCVLQNRLAARTLVEVMKRYDGVRYNIIAYVVMQNHLHVLMVEREGWPVTKVWESWSMWSTRRINTLLKRKGQLWFREPYDRLIRDKRHYNNVLRYIESNINYGGIIWSI